MDRLGPMSERRRLITVAIVGLAIGFIFAWNMREASASKNMKGELSLTCGNGFVEVMEECDDGNTQSGDGCSEGCLFERGRCGDGIVQRALGEECEPMAYMGSVNAVCAADCRVRRSATK